MVRFDNLFGKKSSATKTDAVAVATPDADKAAKDPNLERRSQRLERRELLFAVVRESMARVGVLSTSYKYKVLSLDSRGQQFLIMMDLPMEMAAQVEQLLQIESTIQNNAMNRHQIEVASVYWRISESGRPNTTILRKPRGAAEQDAGAASPSRYEPILPAEMDAFKAGVRPTRNTPSPDAQPDFEATRIEEDSDRMPLSRSQYGDLI